MTVVNPVPESQTIVKFVDQTDLTHHSVDVSLVTIKMLMNLLVLNVNFVTITVLLVKMLVTTVYVHVQKTESIVQLVLVQMVLMMMVQTLYVQIVTLIVPLVPDLEITTVLLVPLT
jgi:hypothetical protein